MPRGCICWIYIQWLDSGWCWAPQGVPALCFTNDNWGFNEVCIGTCICFRLIFQILIMSKTLSNEANQIKNCSATTKDLWGMLLGRFFVGTGMGIGPPVAALYVTEVQLYKK